MPLTFESYWLARAMRRSRATRLLDLCTGSGVHALTGAGNASVVHAIDNNARAVELVRVNSLLNDTYNLSAVVGDLYSTTQVPHDLIVAQPPFALETESRAGENYWSGGATGEEVLARVIAGLPGALGARGRALIMSLIALRTDEDIERKFQGWLGAEGRHIDTVLWARPSPLLQLARQNAEHDQTWRDKLTRWAHQRISGFFLAVIEFRRSPHRSQALRTFQVRRDPWAYRHGAGWR